MQIHVWASADAETSPNDCVACARAPGFYYVVKLSPAGPDAHVRAWLVVNKHNPREIWVGERGCLDSAVC
jgi:hypothetical protein